MFHVNVLRDHGVEYLNEKKTWYTVVATQQAHSETLPLSSRMVQTCSMLTNRVSSEPLSSRMETRPRCSQRIVRGQGRWPSSSDRTTSKCWGAQDYTLYALQRALLEGKVVHAYNYTRPTKGIKTKLEALNKAAMRIIPGMLALPKVFLLKKEAQIKSPP